LTILNLRPVLQILLPNHVCVVIGEVDQVNVIQKGTLEQIKQVTKETIETGKKNGPFIIQSADFLEYNTPVENVEMFVKTALENAAYWIE